jgi:hypothetical protein
VFLRHPLPYQSAYLTASIIGQRRYGFGGYPREEQANRHVDGKIDCDIYGIGHSGTVEAVVQEYIQGLQNQHLPYDQRQAFLAQKFHKFVAKQAIMTKAAMCTDDHKPRAERIKRKNVYKAWQKHGWEQA